MAIVTGNGFKVREKSISERALFFVKSNSFVLVLRSLTYLRKVPSVVPKIEYYMVHKYSALVPSTCTYSTAPSPSASCWPISAASSSSWRYCGWDPPRTRRSTGKDTV